LLAVAPQQSQLHSRKSSHCSILTKPTGSTFTLETIRPSHHKSTAAVAASSTSTSSTPAAAAALAAAIAGLSTPTSAAASALPAPAAAALHTPADAAVSRQRSASTPSVVQGSDQDPEIGPSLGLCRVSSREASSTVRLFGTYKDERWRYHSQGKGFRLVWCDPVLFPRLTQQLSCFGSPG
jgi:hypothetical protein